jgi:energy-coupling factor transport system ATP-binding protein
LIPLPTFDEEPIAALRNIDFSYDNGTEALQGVTLDIWRGEHIALVGGNGSGKTTLAKHLNGLLRPSRGRVFVKGKDTAKESVAALSRTVGYAFQNPDHQLFCPTVAEEVLFGPKNLGFAEAEAAEKADRALNMLSIDHLKGKAPLSLSLGDRRRVSVASVIAMDPEVLVLDEPSTGLDAREAAELMRALDGLNREGKTVILITHEMRLVAEHSERVVVMAHGQVSLDCRTRVAFSEPETLRQSGVIPPVAVQLAHRLHEFDVSPEVLTVDELAEEVARVWGART